MAFNVNLASNFSKTSDSDVVAMCETSRKLSDTSQYNMVRESLISLGKNRFGKEAIDVYFFGSRIIGLATEASDLDIFVDIGRRFRASHDVRMHFSRFQKMLHLLRINSDWRVIKSVLRTPVPVINSDFLAMKLNCEL